MMNPESIEKTGPSFDPRLLAAAQEKTRRAVAAISARMKIGMLEEDAYEIANAALRELGAEKNWHRPWIRFGPNTLKPYGFPSEAGVRLGADDIFFVDIGPVWDGYEGDGGDTFVTGTDPEMARCARDARGLHEEVKELWRRERRTGAKLYEFAVERARAMGWTLSLTQADGHRLSDFPHAVHFRGGMSEIDFAPSPSAWMLEIQLRHPDRPFGAFYEDLLL